MFRSRLITKLRLMFRFSCGRRGLPEIRIVETGCARRAGTERARDRVRPRGRIQNPDQRTD